MNKHKNKKFYITTTLPYVNANPHIGFALEIIQADVIARYKKRQGYDVFFNTGTDEHGLKIYQKSQENGLSPKEFCDKHTERYKALKDLLNLDFNNFIRTTDERHIKGAQEFWRHCAASGDIYKKKYKARYCVGCELFKTNSELENGRCPLHPNQELEIIEEENYFFRFSKYQKPLLDFYKKNPNFVVPQKRFNEIIRFVEQGLKDFSISRLRDRLPWGVPVPGDENQSMYVWFDALVNYITALGWPEDKEKFEAFWPGVQVAGKDNLRQQSAIWQAMLMSAGLPNSKQILIHGFITVQGQKISKSLGNVIDPFALVKKYKTDPVRYFLLREFSPFGDGDFSYERFEERYNADLANGLGNFVSRVLTMAEKRFGKEKIDISPASPVFKEKNEDLESQIFKKMEQFKFNEALAIIWDFISFCDQYIEENKVWGDNNKKNLKNLLFSLEKIAQHLKAFLPETAMRIKSQLEKREKKEVLFPRI